MRFYFMAKTFTPFTYLENRFDSRIRAIISTVYFFTRMSYLSMVIFSCSLVFKGVANWNIPLTICLIGLVAVIYSSLGGLKAVIWVNTIKFFILFGGLGATVAICLSKIDGGAVGVISYSFDHGRGFNFNAEFFSFDPHVRLTFWMLLMSSTISYMFCNSADQVSIQQLLSTSSYKQARNSFITSLAIFIPLGAILWFLGLCMFTYYGQNPVTGGNPPGDIALFRFISEKLPSPLPGLVVSAMLTTAISTSGAAMTGFATVATKDFYLRFINPQASEQKQVKYSRLFTIAIGILASIMAIGIHTTSSHLRETLFEASAIWASISAVVAPVFFIGVVFPRCNAKHAFWSIIVGWAVTTVMVIWYIATKKTDNPISFMMIQIPGFLTVIIMGFLLPFLGSSRRVKEKTDSLTIWTLKPTENIK
jgi:SSS family solute:Na+ symporter